MSTTPGPNPEEQDANREEPHNPVEAGQAAIEAGKIAEGPKAPGQQDKEEAEDAERWRSEG